MESIITKKDNSIRLREIQTKKIFFKWKKKLGVDIGSSFKNLNKVVLWECPETKLKWYTPLKAAGDNELYSQLGGFKWYYQSNKWEFKIALELLGDSCSILEVGAGNGEFLKLASSKGHRVWGIELNKEAIAKLRKHGYKVYESSVEGLPKISKSFDIICAFQVLEHLTNPLEFLKEIIKYLKPNGNLILSVPNDDVLTKIDPNYESLFNAPPHHMSYWNADVFRNLENHLPLKVNDMKYEPLAHYHVNWMTVRYLRQLISPIGKNFSKLLVNRFTTFPLQVFLFLGFRKYFKGHTILVNYTYIPVE